MSVVKDTAVTPSAMYIKNLTQFNTDGTSVHFRLRIFLSILKVVMHLNRVHRGSAVVKTAQQNVVNMYSALPSNYQAVTILRSYNSQTGFDV